jgi:hypothetical protein
MDKTPKKSHWFRNLMLIIIIGLLIWQYVVPFIDDTIKIPSEYIEEILYSERDVNLRFHAFIIDHITGSKTIFPIFLPLPAYETWSYQLQQYHTYTFGMECDLPGALLEEYHWNVEITVYNASSELWETTPISTIIPGYTCWFKSSWTIPEDYLYVNYERDYSIKMVLYDTDGIAIPARDLVPAPDYNYQSISLLKYEAP